jgi:thiamine monophosphate synthase
VVGIGGIHAGNAREVLDAGAVGIAVIGAVAEAEDPVGAVRELRALVDSISEATR